MEETELMVTRKELNKLAKRIETMNREELQEQIQYLIEVVEGFMTVLDNIYNIIGEYGKEEGNG